jgi:hypothetical protein
MRRTAIQIDKVFTRVDVQIDATTGGVGGKDRAGKRRSREDIAAKATCRQRYN